MLKTDDIQIQTFSVSEHPRVIIQNRAGSIHVTSGGEGVVEVRAMTHADWTNTRPEVHMECVEGNTVIVTVDHTQGCFFGTGGGTSFEVRVPATADLDLATNAGSIEVRNIYGQLKLHSNAGSISALQSTLTGSASFQTNAGSIRFTGTIKEQADYVFQTNAGSVDLTVPEDSGLHVEASTNVGAVKTSFPLHIERWIPGARAHGTIGQEPRARIKLGTNAGSLSLYKGAVA